MSNKFNVTVLSSLAILLLSTQFETISSLKIDHGGIKLIKASNKNVKNIKVFNQTDKNGNKMFGGQFTIQKDLSRNLVVNIKTYFDRKGKIIPTPVTMNPNICEAFEKNTLNLKTLFDASNLTPCPIKAGNYKITSWNVDDDQMPALPPGRYQVDLTFIDDKDEIAVIRWHGGILKG